jgi:cell division protein FtsB
MIRLLRWRPPVPRLPNVRMPAVRLSRLGARAPVPPPAVRKAVWPALAGLALVAFLFLAVFPTRTWWSQRQQHARVARQVEVLAEQNRALAERAQRLQNEAEIERLAREQYGMVRPGEEAFAVLPQLPKQDPEPARRRPEPPDGWWGWLRRHLFQVF